MKNNPPLVLAACLLPALLAQQPEAPYSTQTDAEGIATLIDEASGVRARISPANGGELCGLAFRFRNEWRELLYRACDYRPAAGWRGKAPLLWPATGAGGVYTVAAKRYEMPFHGFAQAMRWKLESLRSGADAARARLSLEATDATRKVYPFDWRLTVDYLLREGRLLLRYTVEASKQNQERMFFTIGNHITFRVPCVDGPSGGAVRLHTPAGMVFRKDARNLPTGETAPPPFPRTILLAELPRKTAVSLGGYAQQPELALTDPSGLRLSVRHHTDVPPRQPHVQFNLWGDAAEGYISPEPWVGMQGAFVTRRGLTYLDPGRTWQWTIELLPSVSAVD